MRVLIISKNLTGGGAERTEYCSKKMYRKVIRV